MTSLFRSGRSMMTSSHSRFYWVNFGIPLACAVVVFLLFDLTRIDIAFNDLFYDPVAKVFPLDHVHLFEKITHKWARIIPNWTGEIAIVGALLSFLWPRLKAEKHSKIIAFLEKIKVAPVLRFASRHRRDFLYVVFAFSISTGVIHYLKGHTSVYCPIETTQYGGRLNTRSGTRISICCTLQAVVVAGRAVMLRVVLPCWRCTSSRAATAGVIPKR